MGEKVPLTKVLQDLMGRVVQTYDMQQDAFVIDTHSLANGIYLLQVETAGHILRKWIVKSE